MKITLQFCPVVVISLTLFLSCTEPPNQSPVFDEYGSQILMVDNGKISMLVKEPEITTPTGVVIDDKNRIWVIENHTHVRQEDYPGPKVDRLLIFSGYLTENQDKRTIEYATDFVDGMSLSLTKEGKALVTTRASIIQFEDDNGDNIADSRNVLVSLETTERFPHNGMSGMVVGPDNRIYFQCGENFGAPYLLSGTDGTILEGKEREGGSIYRVNIDGSGLERIGTAVWNCFAMTFDPYGNLFAVENDPDSRPPCRLLHIVKGGNYGFQFQHGRDGLSPLTSWFGQLPGTLPMVAGTGEAPSGVIYYEPDRMGQDVEGALLVTAWGDNEIQSFKMEQNGSSFVAQAKTFSKGGRDFYPVGLAIGDAGEVVATDWASVSYAVHGQGRIWKYSKPNQSSSLNPNNLSTESSLKELKNALNTPDPRIRTQAADLIIAHHDQSAVELIQSQEIDDPGRMNVLWAFQTTAHPDFKAALEIGLKSKNDLLRAAVMRMMIENNYGTNEAFYLDIIENDPSSLVVREAIYGLHSMESFEQIIPFFEKDDPFIHTAIIATFGKSENLDFLLEHALDENPKKRLGALLCLRRSGDIRARRIIPNFLNDTSPENRLTALKWVAEEKLEAHRSEVDRSLANTSDISRDLFDAYVVTFQYLDGEFDKNKHFMEGDEHVSRTFYKRQKFLLATANNQNFNYEIRKRALSGINPNHSELTFEVLVKFVNEANTGFQIETVRTIGSRMAEPESIEFLQEIALDNNREESVRLEAISGLSNSLANTPGSKDVLIQILEEAEDHSKLTEEAMRSLETLSGDPDIEPWIESYKNLLPSEELVDSKDFWRNEGQKKGDALTGARIFHSTRYQCSSCHRIDGRGGIFGPDLSEVGGNADRQRIIESLLDPDAIVTPAYSGYAVSTEEDVVVGRLDKDLDSKNHLQMIIASGERKAIAYDEITEQTLLKNSLMTPNLHKRMTAGEFRDLIQYLVEQQ